MEFTVGQTLINNNIPKEYQIPSHASAKQIKEIFAKWAREDPISYSKNIPYIKRMGDQIATYEGLSVGLDDLTPMIKERDKFLAPYLKKFNSATSEATKKEIVANAMQEASSLVLGNKGSLGEMVRSETKGTSSQLMKNIFSPISAREEDNTPYPFIGTKSFAEGLSPAEYWVSSIEARNATVAGKTQVAEPGDFGKQLFNALNTMVVTTNDCGTTNGLMLSIDDPNVLDRYAARDIPNVVKRNNLITNKTVEVARKANLKEIMVRSPLTCQAKHGVCQFCYGLNASGRLHSIGQNVGTIAAQSLSEPLTQMKLSTKHGVTLAGKQLEDVGMAGVRKLLAKPETSPTRATISETTGTIDRITKAPQGGYYVHINKIEHYVSPQNELKVKEKDSVNKGDLLSSGIADLKHLTSLKGLGDGRKYFIDAMYNAYNPLDTKTNKRTGIPIDKRHLEVLAKKDFNHVIIDTHSPSYAKNDIVEYNQVKNVLQSNTKEIPLREAIGEYLGEDYFYFTAGTQITPQIQQYLQNHGVNKVIITKETLKFSPYVTNVRQVPLLKKDFLAKLTHHELKNTLIEASQLGEKSDLISYDPIPGFVQGVTFGEDPHGKY